MKQRLSDEAYRRAYEKEVQDYVEFMAVQTADTAFYEAHRPLLTVKGDSRRVICWTRYSEAHGGLKAMNPDGTYRPWSPGELAK